MKKSHKGLFGRAYVRWLVAKGGMYREIKDMYRVERSLYVVAKKFGLSRSRISQIVNTK